MPNYKASDIDAPGTRELQFVDVADAIDNIVRLADGCRFGDCTH